MQLSERAGSMVDARLGRLVVAANAGFEAAAAAAF